MGSSEHLYLQIAAIFEKQIMSGILKTGDRLPSVRVLSREQGVSISTSLQSYYHLEAKGLIESRPQSGYFVSFSPKHFPAVPSRSAPEQTTASDDAAEMISEVFGNSGDMNMVKLSMSVPSEELLPVARLNKAMTEAMRKLKSGGTIYDSVEGNEDLRRQIARWSMNWGGKPASDDIITTAGCMNALSFSMMAVANPGDTIAVESPCYFGVLQLARSMGIHIAELPTDPITGIDPDALRKHLALGKTQAVVLNSNFSNPLSSCIPDENKQEIVRIIQRYNTPLIEDDIYGDVYFGKGRPRCCKTYDDSGLVLLCGSVSKTLAPGYRVGWVIPGKYIEKIKRLKMYHTVASATIQQQAVAMFLENGRYEHHLRRLRNTLHANSLQYTRAVSEYFPKKTKISRPQGGFLLWLELDPRINTYELYKQAMQYGISTSPGRMFTMQNQYQNCIRLSYGMIWDEKINKSLQVIGMLAAKML
jgi:DNA-binding transcriptional MocR family regulator